MGLYPLNSMSRVSSLLSRNCVVGTLGNVLNTSFSDDFLLKLCFALEQNSRLAIMVSGLFSVFSVIL